MTSGPVTVFGGTGFLGRRIVECLAAAGCDVRVAVRHPERASFREGGIGRDGGDRRGGRDRRDDRNGRDGQEDGSGHDAGGGRIEVVRADVWDEPTVARAVEGAASIINTVGHYVEKRGATFDAIHGRGAQHVARQAKAAGAARLVHISGLGADPGSGSPYVRARGIGENLVREAFNGATILRPSVIFGPGDAFVNKLAAMGRQAPILPLFGTGGTRLQPVFVGDVAEACAKVLADPSSQGRVYELGGPRVYAYRDLVRLVLDRAGTRTALVPVPFLVWDVLAATLSLLPSPPITRDQVKLMKRDNVVGREALALSDLGIRPVALEEVLSDCIGAAPT